MSANAQVAIMNEGPPPVHHTLRPHHLQLLKIIHTLFIKQNDKYLPQPFLLNVYRILLTEIAEVCPIVRVTQYDSYCTIGQAARYLGRTHG